MPRDCLTATASRNVGARPISTALRCVARQAPRLRVAPKLGRPSIPSPVNPLAAELWSLPHAPVPRSGAVWLEAAAPTLLVVHALLAIALLGATTHDAILVIGFLRGRFGRARLERLYVRIQLVAYLATFLVGSVIYPAYRIYVRAAVFDRWAPWASNLFDVKENFAALGLAVTIAYAWLRGRFEPARDAAWGPLYAVLGLTVAALVWFQVVAGLVLVAERGL